MLVFYDFFLFFSSLAFNCSARRNACMPRFIRTTVIVVVVIIIIIIIIIIINPVKMDHSQLIHYMITACSLYVSSCFDAFWLTDTP